MDAQHKEKKRMVIVSNRLPITAAMEGGQLRFKPASGGLITAVAPLLRNRGGLWIGWSGTNHAEIGQVEVGLDNLGRSMGFNLIDVPLKKEEVDQFYLGFSNQVLWPLFHDLETKCHFLPSYWGGYTSVTDKFAEVVINHSSSDDFIWIHDYQLLLLGDSLRKRGVVMPLSFFLHIPFPPVEAFVKLPWRYEILHAMLQYDLIGFQTARDKRNFLHCIRLLVKEASLVNCGSIHECTFNNRIIKIGAFPISIDFKEFSSSANSSLTDARIKEIKGSFHDQHLILSIDRLDYTKGIPYRLLAIQEFFTKYPQWIGKVAFVQFMIPSRTEIPKYQSLKRKVEAQISDINGKFSTNGWVPIHYFYRPLDPVELVAYYRTSAIALVTPIKDGMNLVCKEYIACNIEKKGVLILSEFAGAAAQLYNEALTVNPYDIQGIARAIQQALVLSMEEKQNRMKAMRRNVKRQDVYWWLNIYLKTAFGQQLNDFPLIEEYFPLLTPDCNPNPPKNGR